VARDGTRMSEEFLWAGQDDAARSDAMMTRSTRENFPVALRLLPARRRRHLMAVYGFARITDDIGDEAPPAERPRMLDELEADLLRINGGQPQLPVIRALAPTVRDLGVPMQPFLDLIAANRQDQIVVRYQTFDELLGYCKLSANPVGRIVLYVFGAYSQPRAELSDRVCTALQLAEHWQDVAEDHRAGRTYLPAEDLERFGVSVGDLAATAATAAFKDLMAFEAERARRMLDDGAPLVGTLRGTARLAVAGYVAGGRAALASIAAAGYDVLAAQAVPARRRLAAELLTAVVTGR
jgi:squalene synthase HpnC